MNILFSRTFETTSQSRDAQTLPEISAEGNVYVTKTGSLGARTIDRDIVPAP